MRLLILDDAGGRVRELRVPRAAFWFALSAGLALFLAVVGLSVLLWTDALANEALQSSATRLPLAQQLEPRVLPKLTPALKDTPCGQGMVLVEGEFCPKVVQHCQKYADPEGSMLRALRCAEYEAKARCQSETRVKLRYCIDRDEYAEGKEERPSHQLTLAGALASCQGRGKRLCTSDEWTFACEGEDMRPYPYGFVRDPKLCNIDRSDLVTSDGSLKDLRAAPGSYPGCVSPFGVRQLSGNLEEFVLDKNAVAQRRGGYWQPGANDCRAAELHDDPSYAGVELGFRCCADAPKSH